MNVEQLIRDFEAAVSSRDRMEALGVISLLVGIAMRDPEGERRLEQLLERFASAFGQGEPSSAEGGPGSDATMEELQQFISEESIRLGDGVDALRRKRLLAAIGAYRKKKVAPEPMPSSRGREHGGSASRDKCRWCKAVWIMGSLVVIGAITATVLVLRDK